MIVKIILVMMIITIIIEIDDYKNNIKNSYDNDFFLFRK